MKNISPELATHLAGEVTTLATCWKLKRRDNEMFGFTDHDKDITFEGAEYKAASGFTPTAIANNASLSVDNLDIEGMLSSISLTEEDILAGKYDFAEIEIFKVNYVDLSQGSLKLRRGWLGEVSIKNHQFIAEVRGLTQRLSQTIGDLYSPSCRATLGDSRCKVNMSSHTYSGAVTGVTSNQIFIDSGRNEASGTFTLGIITFDSGVNAGFSMEIKEHVYISGAGGSIVLALPMPYAISEDDTYTITEGCDKTLVTCKQRFDNVINFHGEPHIPGLDRMLETAGTRGEYR